MPAPITTQSQAMMDNHVRTNVLIVLEQNKTSVRQLADELGCAHSAIARWLRSDSGKVNVRGALMLAILGWLSDHGRVLNFSGYTAAGVR